MEDRGIFADKLEKLFQNVRKPDGSEYSEVEVEAGIAAQGEKVTHSYIYRLRRGLSKNPSYEKIKALAAFFNVSPAYFFEEEEGEGESLGQPIPLSVDLESIAMSADEIEDEAAKSAVLQMLMLIKETREQVESTQQKK